jgi:hypothetical protein
VPQRLIAGEFECHTGPHQVEQAIGKRAAQPRVCALVDLRDEPEQGVPPG